MVHDVVVVGGSTAGLALASLLARRGKQVTVLERDRTLRPVRRTLIVTDRMRDFLGPAGESSIVHRVDRFELYADGLVASIPLSRPDLIVERSTLIRSLAEEAVSAGAVVESAHRFVGLDPHDEGISVRVEEGPPILARHVVGADGTGSTVAREAGWPALPTVPLLQAIVALPEGLAPNTSRVWFRPQDTPYFYWLIPESNDRGALGVIGEGSTSVRRRLDRFLGEQGLEALEYQAARIPLYAGPSPIRRRLGGGSVYLVGDAAGHVKVSTVGGIVTGFRGVHAVAGAIESGRGGRKGRALRRELGLHRTIRRALHRFDEDDYRTLLRSLNGSTSRVLERYTRDEAARMMTHLVLARPKLALLAVRRLLSRPAVLRAPAPDGDVGSVL